jgi:hypothetical protein
MASASARQIGKFDIVLQSMIDLQILIISLDGIPNFALALNNHIFRLLLSDEFAVYPNPTSDFISVVLPPQF